MFSIYLAFENHTPPGGGGLFNSKKYFDVTFRDMGGGAQMPNLVGIHPVVWAPNPGQTTKQTNKQTGLLFIIKLLLL